MARIEVWRDYFRLARNPSRIDGKCGDHFLQADLDISVLIGFR
jgi:hypothetical protein